MFCKFYDDIRINYLVCCRRNLTLSYLRSFESVYLITYAWTSTLSQIISHMKMNSTEWKWTKMALLGIRHTPAIILIPEHKPWHNNNSNAHCKVNQIMTNCAINIHFCTLVAKTHKVILCFYLSQSFYLKKSCTNAGHVYVILRLSPSFAALYALWIMQFHSNWVISDSTINLKWPNF